MIELIAYVEDCCSKLLSLYHRVLNVVIELMSL